MIKKFIVVLAATAVMSVTMPAFASTADAAGSGTNEGYHEQSEATTNMSYKVDPQYTVTIPASIELTGTYGTVLSGTATMSAENVFLRPKQYISVTLASGNDFTMKNEADDSIVLSYSVTGYANAEVSSGTENATNVEIAHFITKKETQTQNVTFAAPAKAVYAGTYKGTVKFTIKVVTPGQTIETP